MSYFGTTDWYERVAQDLVPNYSIIDKWGRNGAVGTTGDAIVSETLAGVFWTPTAASTVRIKAGGNANDTIAGTGARKIIIQGLDENYEFATETINTNGASASSSTTTTFTRLFRAFVDEVGTYRGLNLGEIILENTAGTSDIITVDFQSGTGTGQSLHCQYSVPANNRVWLLALHYAVDGTKTNDVRLMVTDDISAVAAPFGASRLLVEFEGVTTDIAYIPPAPFLLNKPGIQSPIDIWVEGLVSASTSIVSARMQLLIFDEGV